MGGGLTRGNDGGGSLRLIPLGGLGEFGLNALVVETAGRLLLVDAGMMFPGSDTPGVDSVVPDFAFLAENRGRLDGIVLTHGHEDHIGALFFALEAAPAPVWGTRLTLGLARRRLAERGLSADLRPLAPGIASQIGPFRVRSIRVAHSIADSLAVAIETPAGTVVLSGDFKIDATAPVEERTDTEALSACGDRGVLALVSDSTNVEQRGHTAGEDSLLPVFEEVFARSRGRVLISCFATSIPRIQRLASLARAHGREVAFVGRRMVDNTDVALGLGLLRLPTASIVTSTDLDRIPPDRQALFVAGSQGEPFSALSLIAVDEHREVSVGPGDTVVLSARAIPGNERSVSRLISNLFRRGCDVVHQGTARVHVSGHASQEDLLDLLRLVRPKYLVPAHGEYRMLAQHARLAAGAGFPADRILLAEDGDVLAFHGDTARKDGQVPVGRVFLDRSGLDELEDTVVRDRRHLSADGIVVPVVVLDRQTGRVGSPPEIVTRGFVDEGGRADLIEEAGRLLIETVETRPSEERSDSALTRERIRIELRRFFKRRTQRRPMVIPVVMEV